MAAATSPPVQLSATQTVRPAARFASTTFCAAATSSSGRIVSMSLRSERTDGNGGGLGAVLAIGRGDLHGRDDRRDRVLRRQRRYHGQEAIGRAAIGRRDLLRDDRPGE